jgi:hypothetical protein
MMFGVTSTFARTPAPSDAEVYIISPQDGDTVTRPALDAPIPADGNHKHFGGGQTETTIELTPGKHTLQLILGDKLHIPHEPPVMSRKITITVK